MLTKTFPANISTQCFEGRTYFNFLTLVTHPRKSRQQITKGCRNGAQNGNIQKEQISEMTKWPTLLHILPEICDQSKIPDENLINFRNHYWRRKSQPTPVLLPGKSQESDMTEQNNNHNYLRMIKLDFQDSTVSLPVI